MPKLKSNTKVPIDTDIAMKMYYAGFSMSQISKCEFILTGRDKPINEETLRRHIIKYSDRKKY